MCLLSHPSTGSTLSPRLLLLGSFRGINLIFPSTSLGSLWYLFLFWTPDCICTPSRKSVMISSRPPANFFIMFLKLLRIYTVVFSSFDPIAWILFFLLPWGIPSFSDLSWVPFVVFDSYFSIVFVTRILFELVLPFPCRNDRALFPSPLSFLYFPLCLFWSFLCLKWISSWS